MERYSALVPHWCEKTEYGTLHPYSSNSHCDRSPRQLCQTLPSLHALKGLAQAKIIKKSVILFRVLIMTI